MIKIICLGKIKEKYLDEMIDDYSKRVNKYHKLNIIELKDENNLEKEAQSILKNIDTKDYVIACDLNGEEMTSLSLAHFIDKTFISKSTITFIIGSSEGVHDLVKQRANKSLCFSQMTFPHGFFRALLLEQLYRTFKINNNETYHK